MVKITADTITDEQIKLARRLDSCDVCGSGLLAPAHHNDLMREYHVFVAIPQEIFTTALYERDYPTARWEARERCAEILNSRVVK